MSQVLELAKQGDTSAIAALINRSLAPQGIKAKVLWEGQTLKVLLEGLEVPDQARFTNYIMQGVRKIGVAIALLEIYGKQSNQQGFAWSQRFQVEGDNFVPVSAADPVTPKAASPQVKVAQADIPQANITQADNSPTDAPLAVSLDGLDPAAVENLAKQGHVDAIAAFVTAALSDREGVESLVELQGDVLKVTIQTKQFLDGPAFCGELGTKLSAIASATVREVEFYKRKSEKTAPFLMKKATIFHPVKVEESNSPQSPTATENLRFNGQTSATSGRRRSIFKFFKIGS